MDWELSHFYDNPRTRQNLSSFEANQNVVLPISNSIPPPQQFFIFQDNNFSSLLKKHKENKAKRIHILQKQFIERIQKVNEGSVIETDAFSSSD